MQNPGNGNKTKEPIAIVGMGCRYPGGANSPQEFWVKLAEGFDGIVEVPDDRWDKDALYHPDFHVQGKINVREGGFVKDIADFDTGFFGISPVEALRMDPQQRILLEASYQAIEDAGMKLEKLSGTKTGVYVGISARDYADIQNASTDRINIGANTNTGGSASIDSNRISYVFNLLGPSFTVDTACSSSLLAIHLACRDIWGGDAEYALAGGANSILKPEPQMGFSKGGFLADDARCKSFDARANGYIRSEGAGMILLKPLSQAVEDGDEIYGMIRGSATNQDGKTNGLTVPNGDQQVDMLRSAYKDGGVNPAEVQYVECHGTGTPVGDPIETKAIGEVIGKKRKSVGKELVIGSVKSNMGHLEPASGIAGISKLLLAMKNKAIPENLHFQSPNPDIPFEECALKVPTELMDWPEHDNGIFAGVNSFGFGGANVHVALEGSRNSHIPVPSEDDGRPHLFVLSARSQEALNGLVKKNIEFLGSVNDSLIDLGYSSGARRSAHDHKLSIVAHSKKELMDNLQAFLDEDARAGTNYTRSSIEKKHKIGFIFSGQGPQWYAMGQQLFKEEPVFKKVIEEIDGYLSKLADWSLIEELNKDEKTSRINETRIAQPAIMAIQVALTELWKSHGIEPDGVVGHSIGEVAAAYASGALSLENATQVIFHRSRGQDAASGKGKMLAVGLTLAQAEKTIQHIKEKVSIATINGPTSVVLSGDTEELEKIAEDLDSRDIFHRFLRINVPFHSHFMEPLKDELLESLKHVKGNNTERDLYSTVTKKKEDGTHLNTEYWYRNVREPVYFVDAYRAMLADGYDVFVEIAPHPILSSGASEMMNQAKVKGFVVPSIRRNEEEKLIFLGSLGQLYTHGIELDFEKIYGGKKRYVKLPFYAWQKERYWLESKLTHELRMGSFFHPHVTKNMQSARESNNFLWDINLDFRTDPYIEDHRVQGPIVYPGAGHVELALSAARQSFGDGFGFLEDLNFLNALFLPDEGDPSEVQIDISSDEGNYFLYTRPKGSGVQWQLCSNGRINHMGDKFESTKIDLEAAKARITEVVDVSSMHEHLYESGLELGPAFRAIKELYAGKDEAVALLTVPESIQSGFEKFNLHPAILDSTFQTLFAVTFSKLKPGQKMGVYIPVHFDRIKFYKKMKDKLWAYGKLEWINEKHSFGNLWLMDEAGELVAEIQGFKSQYLKGSRGEQTGDENRWFYDYAWNMKKTEEEELVRAPKKYITATDKAIKLATGTPDTSNIKEYQKVAERLNELIIASVFAAFNQLDLSLTQGQVVEIAKLPGELGLLEEEQSLLKHLFSTLTAQGYAKESGEGYQIIKVATPGDIEKSFDGLISEHRPFTSEIALIKRVCLNLKSILKNENKGQSVILSTEDWENVDDFFKRSPLNQAINESISSVVQDLVKDLPEEQTLRILEIGGGTASISEKILPFLPENRSLYIFTDKATEVLSKAKRKLSQFSVAQFQGFDLELDIQDQGILSHSFDLVIVSDALHLTKDIQISLEKVQNLVASEGTLLVVEPTKYAPHLQFAMGVNEDWWSPEDDREGTTLISDFESTLKEKEFTAIQTKSFKYDGSESNLYLAQNKVFTWIDAHEAGNPKEEEGHWIIVKGGQPSSQNVAEKLAAKLKEANKAISVISANEISSIKKIIDGESEEFQGVVYLPAIDHVSNDGMSADGLESAHEAHSVPLVALANELDKINFKKAAKMFLVTAGAQTVEPTDEHLSLAQGGYWGLSRVVMNEKPKVRTAIVDFSGNAGDHEIDQLYKELWTKNVEQEIAYRGKKRYAHRLERASADLLESRAKKTVPASGANYHATISEYGVMDNVTLREREEIEIADDEVIIDVKASALNFRDIMLGMGLLSPEAIEGGLFGPRFGLETAGVISKIGSKVTNVKVGDEVLSITPDVFAGRAKAIADHCVHKPKHMSFAEGATIPVVYFTAYYSLDYLCRYEKDEWILVHAAAGGVGIAAIHLAKQRGLNVIATASSSEKHEYIRSLGVEHILNSRSTNFRDDVMKITEGKGVDIVLNSLSGKAIGQSVKCLASYGRFVEIGKTDIYRNSKLNLKPFGNNLSYFGVDVDRLMGQKKVLGGKIFREFMKFFEDQVFPAHPFKSFPIEKITDAFQFLAGARHIGKVILEMGDNEIQVAPQEKYHFQKDASYLVTGGNSGFGIAIAKWMVEQGAKHMILVSRSGPKTEEDEAMIEAMEGMGAKVHIQKADISDKASMDALAKNVAELPTLRGVMHAATVFDDKPLDALDRDSLFKVLNPKMKGAWFLHEMTKDNKDLDFFVNFSSISAVYGNPAQGNYCAGNGFLDQFSYYRNSLGLPATSINWGVIGEVGYVSRTDKVEDMLSNQGWNAFSLLQTTQIMEKMLLFKPVQQVALDADWEVMGEFVQGVSNDTRVGHLVREKELMSGSASGGSDALKASLLDADEVERQSILETNLRDTLSRILGTSAAKIDTSDPITKMGLDSLMANQLRNWIQGQLDLDYSMMKIMRGPSIVELSEQLIDELIGVAGGGDASGGKSEVDKWYVRFKPLKTPRIRLFCFPYFAGGASVFNGWTDLVSNDIEVVGVQLPGREERAAEEPYTDMLELVEKMAEVIEPLLDRPFAVYGHSAGSGLAYELIRHLRKSKGVEPVHFFTGAWQAPQMDTPFDLLKKIKDDEWANLPEHLMLDHLENLEIPREVLDNKELIQEMMPALKADMMMGKHYKYEDDEPLKSPITAFYGSNDTVILEERIRPWSKHSKKCEFVEIEDGSHLFIREKKELVIDTINKNLH